MEGGNTRDNNVAVFKLSPSFIHVLISFKPQVGQSTFYKAFVKKLHNTTAGTLIEGLAQSETFTNNYFTKVGLANIFARVVSVKILQFLSWHN